MNAALELELLKARRAPVFRWGGLAVALGVPALSTGFLELARLGGNSVSAAKVATMVHDISLAGLVAMAGQVLTVAGFLSAGIAVSWSFGREFVDDTAPGLYATATPRTSVAAAKLLVALGWGAATAVLTTGLTVVAGLAVGLAMSDAAVMVAGKALAAGLLSVVLATPLAWVASWRRGYLAGFVALIGLVVVTQVITTVGAGGWFPYAAPGLWMGMGGEALAAQITLPQLLLPLLVGAAAAVGVVSWWRTAEAP